MPDLERIVHPPVHPLGVLRKRLALGTGFLIGAAAVAALVHSMVRLHPEALAVPIPAPPAPVITVPPPIVVMIDRTIEAPPQPPPAVELGCPTVGAADYPIGTAIDPAVLEQTFEEQKAATVRAAASAPQLAVEHAGFVWVSDDDGRTFARAFEDHLVDHIAVDPDGVIYAQSSDLLAVRVPGGKTRWRAIRQLGCTPEDRCERTIGARGKELVVIADDRISTSTDRGQSFTSVRDPAFAWGDHGPQLFSWRGSLYQVSHYWDMCGVNDYPTYRLDTAHQVAHDTFHDYFTENAPELVASSDVESTWTWRETCRTEPDKVSRCANNAARSALLIAATLRPAEGARTLAVYNGSAVELCPGGVRQIYRKFPYDRIDAVDVAGRALVMRDLTLVRWSPLHGWRKLHTFSAPVPPERGSD